MKVLKWKVFKTNEEFYAWQQKNYPQTIVQMQPLISGFGMDIGESTAQAEASCLLFVVYLEEVEE